MNLPHYDERVVHFGILLGVNNYGSWLKVKDPLPQPDKVIGANVQGQYGFQVGFIADLKLNNYIRLRTQIPTISFGDRKFNFSMYEVVDMAGNQRLVTKSTDIEAIYLEVPLEFKIQSKRWKDFRPYLIAGGKWAYDLASLRKKKIADDEMLLKLQTTDLMYTAGVGFDFYLEYFKFGIELKSSFGMKNMLIPEEQKPTSNVIDGYKTQIFYITLTFE